MKYTNVPMVTYSSGMLMESRSSSSKVIPLVYIGFYHYCLLISWYQYAVVCYGCMYGGGGFEQQEVNYWSREAQFATQSVCPLTIFLLLASQAAVIVIIPTYLHAYIHVATSSSLPICHYETAAAWGHFQMQEAQIYKSTLSYFCVHKKILSQGHFQCVLSALQHAYGCAYLCPISTIPQLHLKYMYTQIPVLRVLDCAHVQAGWQALIGGILGCT